MTVELAVMNREAVALAADSAVTVSGKKVFTSASKLFSLSRRQPIGAMIYGDPELLRVPWETLVKLYRHEHGGSICQSISDCATQFIRFLSDQSVCFPEQAQGQFVEARVYWEFAALVEEAGKDIESVLEQDGSLSEDKAYAVYGDAVLAAREARLSWDYLSGFSADDEQTLRSLYADSAAAAAAAVFELVAEDPAVMRALVDIGVWSLCRRRPTFHPWASGVVICGFGEQEVFPHLEHLMVSGYAGGRLLYEHVAHRAVSHEEEAWVLPFAQSDMVRTFMEGVDESYQDELTGVIAAGLNAFAYVAAEEVGATPEVRGALGQAAESIASDAVARLDRFRSERFSEPVMEVVSYLPKNELAELAESLVTLTSLRRRVTMDVETVSGPVDVAVISKGDGFVWI